GGAVLGFLHHHVAVVGGVRRRCGRGRRVSALGKGGHREAAHQHQAGAKGGKGSENLFILHGSFPPVRDWQNPPPGRAPCRQTAWRTAGPGSYAGRGPSGRSPGSPPRFSALDRKSTRLNSSHVSISY